jgi:hypothetical protein
MHDFLNTVTGQKLEEHIRRQVNESSPSRTLSDKIIRYAMLLSKNGQNSQLCRRIILDGLRS